MLCSPLPWRCSGTGSGSSSSRLVLSRKLTAVLIPVDFLSPPSFDLHGNDPTAAPRLRGEGSSVSRASTDCARLCFVHMWRRGRQPRLGFGEQCKRQDVTGVSFKPVTASQRLTALPRMLTGCHSAFPSDLVHVYGFHWGRQHLSSSAAEQVPLRRGGSC